MICPFCNAKTQVTNSRSTDQNQAVWRRRACTKCFEVWTTKETISLEKTHTVFSSSEKHSQPFSRDILYISIKDSLQHRKNAVADAGALTDTIISRVIALKSPKIERSEIISIATRALQAFDQTAAAVYQAMHK